jgi:hypothetical protein
MKSFILFLAIMCAGARLMLFVAASEDWGRGVCRAARALCDNPEQLAFAAAGLAGLWIVVMFVSAIRH